MLLSQSWVRPLVTATVVGTASLIGMPATRAGSLEPPGPPASTMKTLAEVDPRIPIHPSDLPCTITTPGSYYLTDSPPPAAGRIDVAVSGVTIDLGGFTIDEGGHGPALTSEIGTNFVTIKNGSIRNGLNAIHMPNTGRVVLEDLEIDNVNGIVLGGNAIVRRVIARKAGNGLIVGGGSQVYDSAVYASGFGDGLTAPGALVVVNTSVSGSHGMSVGDNSRIINCDVYGNDDGLYGGTNVTISDTRVTTGGDQAMHLGNGARVTGVSAHGGNLLAAISVGAGSIVADCDVSNSDSGIDAGDASRIHDNMLTDVHYTGIRVTTNSLVSGNHCTRVGHSGSNSAGVEATGSGNRIERNTLIDGTIGVRVQSAENVVVENVAHGNSTANYQIAAGNGVGTIGSAATVNSCWWNIEY